MSLVVFQIIGQFALVSVQSIVYKRYTRNPLTCIYFTVVRLYVVLSADEIPHKIPPVHKIELIGEEEFEIFAHSGDNKLLHLPALVGFYTSSFEVCPLFVCGYVIRYSRKHPREKHFSVGDVFYAFLCLAYVYVLVFGVAVAFSLDRKSVV